MRERSRVSGPTSQKEGNAIEAKKETPQDRYDRKNTAFIGLKLNIKTDKDILEALEGKAKQTEIKRLIRQGLQCEQ